MGGRKEFRGSRVLGKKVYLLVEGRRLTQGNTQFTCDKERINLNGNKRGGKTGNESDIKFEGEQKKIWVK